MKKLFKILCAALAMCMTLAPVGVFAADNYAPVNGTSTSFDKYLIVDENAKVPAIEFDYTIAPGTAIPASSGKMAVLAGVGTPTVGSAVFTEGEAKAATAAAGDEVTLAAGEQYAKKTVSIDFSGVAFPEPGIYRYVLTEQQVAGHTDIEYDVQKPASAQTNVRILDVYVTDNNGALEVSSYVLHASATDVAAGADMGSNDVAAALAQVSDKSKGFVNKFDTQELEFGKEITGNQGAKDKYFDFTLALENLQPGMTYEVDLSACQATSGSNEATIAANAGKTNAATITADSKGKATVHYYLNDGQYVKVKGLPKDATYALTENAEDYKSTATIAESVAKHGDIAHTDAVSGTIDADDVYTGFVNTRNGIVPTGVAMSVASGVVLIGGAIIVLARRRKDEE